MKTILDYIGMTSASEVAFSKRIQSNGIYCWYLPAPKNDGSLNLDQIFRYLKGFRTVHTSEKIEGKRVSVDISGKESSLSPAALSEIETSAYMRAMQLLPILNPPIYTGYARRAEGISGRIKEHLRDGTFNDKLRQAIADADLSAIISPKDCTVIYFCFSNFCEDSNYQLTEIEEERVLRALERAFFCSYFPIMNTKEGN